ncbi:hypothetical protein Mal15_61500 [Stieleria maiorica]|uniref:DUF7450 domain-containing protein n=1 Tax=Stieleria maiorica TaxID=2795974 RepID=A0A5B9MPY5_9BACT|nr:hypothetical protein [Stieleria maiorica]QEG02067.1 hypothetical protein Mal15_61500 [Stieleria maiorica]
MSVLPCSALPFRVLLPAVLIALASVPQTVAESPHDVVSVAASNPVLHGLEVKTELDEKRRWINFRGPKLYSSPRDKSQADDARPSYLNWYSIRKPDSEAVKTIQLRDTYSGSQSFGVRLGQPAFYLIPAQTVADGPPAEVPESLDHFIAFEIVDVDSLALPEPTPGKPAFVCVPAEEWHHEEHVPIKSASSFLMVYAVEASSVDGRVTTIDSFGLNQLTVTSKEFVAVAASRVR